MNSVFPFFQCILTFYCFIYLFEYSVGQCGHFTKKMADLDRVTKQMRNHNYFFCIPVLVSKTFYVKSDIKSFSESVVDPIMV